LFGLEVCSVFSETVSPDDTARLEDGRLYADVLVFFEVENVEVVCESFLENDELKFGGKGQKLERRHLRMI
jgi:hypothetical protein